MCLIFHTGKCQEKRSPNKPSRSRGKRSHGKPPVSRVPSGIALPSGQFRPDDSTFFDDAYFIPCQEAAKWTSGVHYSQLQAFAAMQQTAQGNMDAKLSQAAEELARGIKTGVQHGLDEIRANVAVNTTATSDMKKQVEEMKKAAEEEQQRGDAKRRARQRQTEDDTLGEQARKQGREEALRDEGEKRKEAQARQEERQADMESVENKLRDEIAKLAAKQQQAEEKAPRRRRQGTPPSRGASRNPRDSPYSQYTTRCHHGPTREEPRWPPNPQLFQFFPQQFTAQENGYQSGYRRGRPCSMDEFASGGNANSPPSREYPSQEDVYRRGPGPTTTYYNGLNGYWR